MPVPSANAVVAEARLHLVALVSYFLGGAIAKGIVISFKSDQ